MRIRTIVAIVAALLVAVSVGGAALVACVKLVLVFLMFGMMAAG